MLHGEHVSGAAFFVRTWAPALAAAISIVTYSLIGLAVVPVSLAAALAATYA